MLWDVAGAEAVSEETQSLMQLAAFRAQTHKADIQIIPQVFQNTHQTFPSETAA